MPTHVIDGIDTHYEVLGTGAPLLMFSPGGFDATIEKWRTLGVYARTKPLDHLSKRYQCIVFDRRETGESGGRIEAVTWHHYVQQGRGLLDHLGIPRAHLMGGCMGCSVAVAFAVTYPEATRSMILWWPVGGAKYRINAESRFTQHLDFVVERGLANVVALVKGQTKSFSEDPRGGPWGSVIRRDEAFAQTYAAFDTSNYIRAVRNMMHGLFDRDTSPGAKPEDLLKLSIPTYIVPGRDASHATSAARYLEECIVGAQYWDEPVDEQTEARAATNLLGFLDGVATA